MAGRIAIFQGSLCLSRLRCPKVRHEYRGHAGGIIAPAPDFRELQPFLESPPLARRLQRVAIGLAGADAHRVLEVHYEDLAVADLAGAG
jgi:hypothetical protein